MLDQQPKQLVIVRTFRRKKPSNSDKINRIKRNMLQIAKWKILSIKKQNKRELFGKEIKA